MRERKAVISFLTILCLLSHYSTSFLHSSSSTMSGRKISNFFQPILKKAKSTHTTDQSNTGIIVLNATPSPASTPLDSIDKTAVDEIVTNITESEVSIESSSTNILSNLIDGLEDGWKSRLIKQTQKPYFKTLESFLDNEMTTKTIYPAKADIFSCFNLCPFDQVKVVIVGQDPYHGPNQGTYIHNMHIDIV